MLRVARFALFIVFCGLWARPAAAQSRWGIQISPAAHRMILEQLTTAAGDPAVLDEANGIFRAYQKELRAQDQVFIDLSQWNRGLEGSHYGAIDDELTARNIATARRLDAQQRAMHWAAIDQYFDQLAALRGVDEDLLRRLQKRHFVLLVLNDPLAANPTGISIGLDETTLRSLPSFDDEARRILREAIDAHAVEIEPLVRKYQDASIAVANRNEHLTAAHRSARAGDMDAAREHAREYVEQFDRLVDATLPIRAAHDRLAATVVSQLPYEQAQSFQRATSLLRGSISSHYPTLLLRLESALASERLPAARRVELEKHHAELEAILTERARTINKLSPRFRDTDWQHDVARFVVDSLIARSIGEPPLDPPASLPDYNALNTKHFAELNRIDRAVTALLPPDREEFQP